MEGEREGEGEESKMNITREQYHSLKGGHPTSFSFDTSNIRRYDQIRYLCVMNFGEADQIGVMMVTEVENGKITCVL